MRHLPLPPRGPLAAAVLLLLASVAGAAPFSGPFAGPGPGNPGSTSPYPPSYYGYPLDEIAPSRYGGGNYTRYFAYGPGFGVAGFPGPLPAAVDREFPRLVMGETGFFAHPYRPGPVDVGYLCVRVPEGAQVWLEGQPTQQTGAVRWFVSPTLPPGIPHVYEVRVRWSEQGKDVEQTQQVIVRAGEQAQVAFPTAAP
jgi:uncharacterized protein (TIGR03000 family)